MLLTSFKAFQRFRTAGASRRTRFVRQSSAEVLESRVMLSATLWVDHATPSAYQTIQAAVNAATAGSTILVAPGIYPEAVTVSTKGLTIRGGQIHVRGETGPSIVETSGVAFTLEANNILLGRFTILPPGNSLGSGGVQITAGSGDTVQNSLIESESVGITVATASNTILSNELQDCSVGISVTGSANSITSNLVDASSGDGISVDTTGSTTVGQNTVEDGASEGIVITSGSTTTVTGNTVENNQGTGIDITDSTGSVVVQQNKVPSNMVNGILIQSALTATVTGNVTDGNQGGGIVVDASTATVISNTADDNNGFGLFVFGGATATLKNNSTNNNVLTGVDLGMTSLILSCNVSNGNGGRGPRVFYRDRL